jgi:L-glyceraldehyde 3-phosphate reductase
MIVGGAKRMRFNRKTGRGLREGFCERRGGHALTSAGTGTKAVDGGTGRAHFLGMSSRYEKMTYQRCGKSGVMLPRISLGLWQNFGEGDSQKNAREIILRAFDLGITHFDLANNYGPPPGSAETNFGRILKADLLAHRDEMIISTKAGYTMWEGPYGDWGSRKYLLASLDQSLKRMGLAYVDIFYHHRPDPETPLEESMGALATAVRQGKALYAGISNYKPEETMRAATILRRLGTPCLIHQPRYNLLDRWIEDGLTTVLEKEGIGGIVFSPLAQGQLTDRYLKEIPKDSRAGRGGSGVRTLKNPDVERNLPIIRALNAIALKRGQSLAEMALAWVLRLPAVTSALVGASSVAQLEANVATLKNLEFSPAELVEIREIVRSAGAFVKLPRRKHSDLSEVERQEEAAALKQKRRALHAPR